MGLAYILRGTFQEDVTDLHTVAARPKSVQIFLVSTKIRAKLPQGCAL